MDFLAARQRREWLLIALVGALALTANLPGPLLASIGLDPRYLMAVLGLLVLLALFLYVRFFFFLIYALLAIGANIPDQWAQTLGLDRIVLILTLGAMVVLSLLNYKVKLLPSGLEAKGRTRRSHSPEGLKALLTAVEKGHIGNAGKVLAMNIDPNDTGDGGYAPLARAAERGDKSMIELLLNHGADIAMKDTHGKSALDYATQSGHAAIADLLKTRLAEATASANPTDVESKLGA